MELFRPQNIKEHFAAFDTICDATQVCECHPAQHKCHYVRFSITRMHSHTRVTPFDARASTIQRSCGVGAGAPGRDHLPNMAGAPKRNH